MTDVSPTSGDQQVYSDAEVELLRAVDKYKKKHNRRFPTVCEIMKVMQSLGYRKVTEDDHAGYNAKADETVGRDPLCAPGPDARDLARDDQ